MSETNERRVPFDYTGMKANEHYAFFRDDLPCEKCGSGDIFYQAYQMKDGRLAVEKTCYDCGFSRMIRKESIDRNRGSARQQALWSEAVKKRDGYKCILCNATSQLHAHHILRVADDLMGKHVFDVNNGVTLCLDCHNKVHGGWMKKSTDGSQKQITIPLGCIESYIDTLAEAQPSIAYALRTAVVNVEFNRESKHVDVTATHTKRQAMMSKLLEHKTGTIEKYLSEHLSQDIGEKLYVVFRPVVATDTPA